MSIKLITAGLLCLSLGATGAMAETILVAPPPKAAAAGADTPAPKVQKRKLAAPEAPLPSMPGAPVAYDSVRETPAAPIPYKSLNVGQIDPTPPALPELAPSVDRIGMEEIVPVATQTGTTAKTITGDATYEERLRLSQRLLEVDGTEAIVRHFVNEVHMRLIIAEVGKYVDLKALSETDRYRLATIAAVAATELGDKILVLNARIHAQNMTGDELAYLIQVNDTDAQRKLTQMRIDDTGELDRNAELLMQIAALKIVQEFESTP